MFYHNTFVEVSGDTPADIVQQLYEDSRRGIGPDLTKQEWWEYQRTVWRRMERKTLPATPDDKGAAERFLQIVVEVGALEEGPKPG